MGFVIPSYSTVKSGPSHAPTFVSIVEVGGVRYEGLGCKTKKQSEMSAAKVAFEKLTSGNADHCSPVSTLSKNTVGSCRGVLVADVNNCQVPGAQITSKSPLKRASGEMNAHPGMVSCGSDGKLSSHLDPNSLQNILPTLAPAFKETKMDKVEGDGEAKRHKCSASGSISRHLPEEFPPPSDLSVDPSPGYMPPSESLKYEETRPAESGSPPNTKILIFRHGSRMEIPEGAVELPWQDDEWVAMRVPLGQDQLTGIIQ